MKPWERYSGQAETVTAGPWERFAAPVAEQGQKEGIGRTAFDQAMQGATFGFADEISDLIGAGFASLATGEDYGQMLDEARLLTADRQARQWEQNPGTAIAGNIVGGLATGVSGTAKLLSTKAGTAAGNFLRNSNLPTKIAAGSLSGAASGGLYGFGSEQGDERWEAAGKGALLGAATGAAVPAAVAGFNSLNTRTILPNSEEIKKAASAAYLKADQLGGTLKPEFTNGFLESARNYLLSGDELIDAMQSNKPLADAFSDLSVFQNQPMTLQRAQALDEQIGNMVDGFVDAQGNMSKAGKKILDVQSSFRQMIENADETAMTGGKEGFEALKEGRKLWSSSRRLADIERIIDNAEMYQVPATAIKTGFRRLAKNAKSLGYSEDEIKAIRSAAETGAVTDLMATFGSRLGAIVGAATGGAPGAVLGYGVSTASRAGATASQMSRANSAARKVAERSGMVRTEKRLDPTKLKQIMGMSPRQAQQAMRELDEVPISAQPEPPRLLEGPSPQRALPAPHRDIVVDPSGNARMNNATQQDKAILGRQRAEQLGMTPDVARNLDNKARQQLMQKYGQSELGRFLAENPNIPLYDLRDEIGRQVMKMPPAQAEEILEMIQGQRRPFVVDSQGNQHYYQ